MLKPRVQDITPADILRLRDNHVTEGTTIDYKQEFSYKGDDANEFLQDLVSFANTHGGHILVGVKELREDGAKQGYPDEFFSVELPSLDAFRLDVESMLRDNTQPNVRGFQADFVEVEGAKVLVISIPRSFVGPHLISRKGTTRFVARNSAGKYQMDWAHIRDAFGAYGNQIDRMRGFRHERVAQITAGLTPVKLSSRALAVIHLLPVETFANPEFVLDPLIQYPPSFRSPEGGTQLGQNFDGRFMYDHPNQFQPGHGYVQSFRNGAIEAVQGEYWFNTFGAEQIPRGHFDMRIDYQILKTIEGYQNLLAGLGFVAPVQVGVSFVGIRDFMIVKPQTIEFMQLADQRKPLDRDTLVFPEVTLNRLDYDEYEIAALFKPTLDLLWQSMGLNRCWFYDKGGNYH